ncbi:hypothetical protein K474DRAFT_1689475 [Panus rudis PR-1116 ss-1]|nr:hypothetical protein K474DRAFT_1689475 [Panus rudis PR-1116 ss-1]
MPSPKVSPNRRRSLAVLNPTNAARGILKHHRRAYSIAPGDKLSPVTRAKNMKPRKSILKTSAANQRDSSDNSTATPDETNVHSMDLTEVGPSMPRKSLINRRVSFAGHANVLFFQKEQRRAKHRNENDDPQDVAQGNRRSSVRRRSSTGLSENGERSMDLDDDSMADESQDYLAGIYRDGEEATNGDGYELTYSDEDYGNDDEMDITQPIDPQIIRKRSLSLGGPKGFPDRRRSSIGPLTSSQRQSENQPPQSWMAEEEDVEETMNYGRDQEDATTSSNNTGSYLSQGDGSSGEVTQPMEITVPINRPLRPSTAHEDELLQRLRAVTHAGSSGEPDPPSDYEEPFEPDAIIPLDDLGGDEENNMELTTAMGRLMRARASMGLPIQAPLVSPSKRGHHEDDESDDDAVYQLQPANVTEDSFMSEDDSFGHDSGDHTVNITALMRNSQGSQDPSIDVSERQGQSLQEETMDDVLDMTLTYAQPAQSSTGNGVAAPQRAVRPPVFTKPPPRTSLVPPSQPSASPDSQATNGPSSQTPRSPLKPPVPATVPKPFSFSRPSTIPAPPSSAFKELSSDGRQPSPTKLPMPVHRGTAAFAPPSAPKSPKRRHEADDVGGPDSEDAPSPAKKGKLSDGTSGQSSQPTPSTSVFVPGNRRASTVRRPSGYFAQRKSMGAGLLPAANAAASSAGAPVDKTDVFRLKRAARASLGTTPAEGSAPLYPDVSRIATEDPPMPSAMRTDGAALNITTEKATDGNRCERESLRQAVAAPSPTRGSPAPAVRFADDNVRLASPARRSGRSASPAMAPPVSAASQLGDSVNATSLPTSSSIESLRQEALPTVDEISMEMDVTTQPAAADEDEEHTEPIDAAQWRAGVQEESSSDEEGPPISIEQFFSMTGIRFMDELTAPRRSTIHPSQLRPRSRRRSLDESTGEPEEPEQIPLSEFVNAMAVDIPQLELYSTVAGELHAWIEESRKMCKEADEEAIKVTPGLFREFAEVEESEKEFLVHQLKLIKVNCQGAARSQWYDWKKDWTEQLQATADTAFLELQSDAKMLEDIIKQAQGMLPNLREEYAQVMAELEQEQADIAEIENSDQDYLNELKSTIAEQDRELEAFRTDVSEAKAKLERLEEKMAEIESQKNEANAVIAQTQHLIHVQKESTSSEVFRLKDELEALQDLHLWRCTKISSNVVEFIYATRYQVIIPCLKFKPQVSKMSISRTKTSRLKERDTFPRFTDFMLEGVRHVVTTLSKPTTRDVLRCLGDFWSCCAQLRSQLSLLAVRFPLEMSCMQDEPLCLKASAAVLFPSLKSKAIITFILDMPTCSRWPLSIGSLKVEVEVAYGRADSIVFPSAKVIETAVRDRLDQASPTDNYGCLLDACIVATEQYD